MSLFARKDRAVAAQLSALLGRNSRVLAYGEGADQLLLAGTREHLALRTDDGWQAWPWEQVKGGSWRSEEQEFQWSTMEGDEFSAQLEEPGRLPELFRERVQASTIATESFDLPGGSVQIVARRAPGGQGECRFYAVPRGRISLDDPAVRDLVVAQTDRLRAELP